MPCKHIPLDLHSLTVKFGIHVHTRKQVERKFLGSSCLRIKRSKQRRQRPTYICIDVSLQTNTRQNNNRTCVCLYVDIHSKRPKSFGTGSHWLQNLFEIHQETSWIALRGHVLRAMVKNRAALEARKASVNGSYQHGVSVCLSTRLFFEARVHH